MVDRRITHILLQGLRGRLGWPFYHYKADMRTKRSRMQNPSPRMQKRPMTTEERKRAHRALPVVTGRVVAVDVTGFTFAVLDCNGVEQVRYRLMRTGLNEKKEEELLASGEIVTMYYTETKQRRKCLLKFERISNTLKDNIERSQGRQQ